MLDGATLARRILSARELRGISQTELGKRMAAEGLGKHDAARIERRDPKAPPFSASRRRALVAILKVPEWWFTAEDDNLFAAEPSRVDKLEEQFAALDGYVRDTLMPLVEGRGADHKEALADANGLGSPGTEPRGRIPRPPKR